MAMSYGKMSGKKSRARAVSSLVVLHQLAAAASPALANSGNTHLPVTGAFPAQHAGAGYQPLSHNTWAASHLNASGAFTSSNGAMHWLPASFGLGVSTLPTTGATSSAARPIMSSTPSSANFAIKGHTIAKSGHQSLRLSETPTTGLTNLLPSLTAVQLDLTSSSASIQLDSGSIKQGSTVTIMVGGERTAFHVGDSVTAGELVAIEQAQAKGGQTIQLDQEGRTVGGTFSLNGVTAATTGYNVSSVVVPAGVTATDRVTANSGVKLSGDLVNYGSILEVGKGTANASSTPGANISALDIVNESGGLIASKSTGKGGVDLSFNAAQDFTNMGTISSAGALAITAGGTLTNGCLVAGQNGGATTPSITATKDITLTSAAINNSGTITSTSGNINLGTVNSQALTVNNTGGTLSTAEGAINVRSSSYNGSADTTVTGGNLLSQQLKINAGGGTANIDVEQLTGTVSSSGNAVHVEASTDMLTLGKQNLSGDPTYYNDKGDITISGDIVVSEDLTIIASGNIFATSGLTQIVATNGSGAGAPINIIAGANVTPSGTDTDATGTITGAPPVSGNATQTVSFTGASTNGGSINLINASPTLLISAAGTTGAGAGIFLGAFAAKSSTSGQVILPLDSTINAGGSAVTGTVTIMAGFQGTGTAIQIGSVSNGASAGAFNLFVLNDQPAVGKTVVFNTNGSIASGFVATNFASLGGGDIHIGGALNINANINIAAGGNVTLDGPISNIGFFSASGKDTITLNSTIVCPEGITLVAGQNIVANNAGKSSLSTSGFGIASNITVVAGASYSETGSTITISGASATGGQIDFTNLDTIVASPLTSGANGGVVNLAAYAGSAPSSGQILAPNTSITAGGLGTGTNGSVVLIAGSTTLPGINIQVPGTIDLSGGVSASSATDVFIASSQPQANMIAKSESTLSNNFSGSAPAGGDINFNNSNITLGGGQLLVSTSGGSVTGTATVFGSGSVSIFGSAVNAPGVDSGASISAYGANATNGNLSIPQNILANNIVLLANSGSIVFNGATSVAGGTGGITIIASGDISTTAASKGLAIFADSSSESAGNITIVAGALNQNAPASTPFTSQQILGASTTGGNIDFATNAIGQLSAQSIFTGGNGGNITLVAYDAAAGGSKGNIIIPTAVTVQSGGGATGNNGDVVVAAGASTGTGGIGNNLNAISINTIGGNAGTGNITLSVTTPLGTSPSPITVDCTTATAGSSFLGGAFQPGVLFTNSLTTTGATVSLILGSNFTVGGALTDASSNLVVNTGGTLTITGNPACDSVAFMAAGNISVQSDIIATGGILLVSGGSIFTSAGGLNISTASSTQATGNITVVAGAAYTYSAGTVSITGASATGGSIDLSTNPLNSLTTNCTDISTPTSAGSINLFAFASAGGANGTISTPTATSQGSLGSGASGNFTAVAGATSGTAINLGNVLTTADFQDGGSGSITVLASAPDVSASNQLTINTFGAITGGNPANTNSPLNPATIIAGLLDAHGQVNGDNNGGNVTLQTGGNVQVQSIDASSGATTATTHAGIVTVITGSSTVSNPLILGDTSGTNFIGMIKAIGTNAGGSGGNVSITTNGTSGITFTSTTALQFETLANLFNHGGNLTIQTNGTLDFGPVTGLSTSTGGASAGGSISLTASDITWATKGVTGGTPFEINASGTASGGTVNVTITGTNTQTISGSGSSALQLVAQGGVGRIDFTAQNAALNLDGSGIDVSTTNTARGGIISIEANGISNATNKITLNADGVTSGAGGSITVTDGLATQTLTIGSGNGNLDLSAAGAGSAGNGGTIQVSSAGGLTVDPTAINVAPQSSGNGRGGTLALVAGGNLLVNGSINVNGAGTGMGGDLALQSGSSTPFTVTGTKLVNGVTGSISATGGSSGNGSLFIDATGGIVNTAAFSSFGSLTEVVFGAVGKNGSITVNGNLGTAGVTSIILQALGTGSVVATKGIVQADNVSAFTDTGAITITKLNATAISAQTSSTAKTGIVTITSVAPSSNSLDIGAASGSTIKITTPGSLTSGVSGPGTITGSTITLTSTATKTATSFDLNGDINEVGTGLITIAAPGAISINGNITGSGSGVKISNKLGMADIDIAGNIATSATGTVTITSALSSISDTGDISGGKTVSLTASKGSLTVNTIGATTNAGAVTMTALVNIETDGGLNANNSIVAKATSASAAQGNIQLGGPLNVFGSKGALTLTAGALGTVTDPAPITGVNLIAGTITITAPGGITLSNAGAAAATGALTFTAAKGSINLSGSGSYDSNAKNLAFTALNSISIGSTLQAVTAVAVKTTSTVAGAGNINLEAGITATGTTGKTVTPGTITLTAGALSNINDGGATSNYSIQAGTVTLIGPGGISLGTSLSTAAVTASSKGLTLTAAKGIIDIDTNATISTTGINAPITLTAGGTNAGTLGVTVNGTVSATGAVTAKASTGDIDMNSSGTITSTAGKVTLTAFNNINEDGSITGQTGISINTTNNKVAADEISLNNLTTNAGPISVIGLGQSVSSSATAIIMAQSSSSKVKATILIDDNNLTKGNTSNVNIGGALSTAGLGGGNVTIAVGPAPTAGKNETTSATGFVITNNTPGFNVFFGATPANIAPPPAGTTALTTQGANIILNTPSPAANVISFQNGSSVTADPPQTAAQLPTLNGLTFPLANAAAPAQAFTTNINSLASGQSGQFVPVSLLNASNAVPSASLVSATANVNSTAALETAQISPLVGRLSQLDTVQPAFLSDIPVTAPAGATLYVLNEDAGGDSTKATAEDAGGDSTKATAAAAGNGSAMRPLQGSAKVVDYSQSAPGWISETEMQGGKIPVSLYRDAKESFEYDGAAKAALSDFRNEAPGVVRLSAGSLLAAPIVDTIFKTPFGQVFVAAKSLVLVMAYSHGLAVYNLHDIHKDAALISVNGKTVSLTPGTSAIIVSESVNDFAHANPAQLICYGKMTEAKLGEGLKVYRAQFSLPSAINALPTLSKLVSSKDARASKISGDFLKTAAIVMQLNGGFANFSQLIKPQLTASNR